VQDVHSAPRPSGEFDHLGDGEVLRAAGPGGQEIGVPFAVGRGRAVDAVGVLGVHDHQRAERGDLAQCLLELYGVQRREFVDPGVQQEAFEPEHAGVV
jgi:hypothetical protein